MLFFDKGDDWSKFDVTSVPDWSDMSAKSKARERGGELKGKGGVKQL